MLYEINALIHGFLWFLGYCEFFAFIAAVRYIGPWLWRHR